MATDKWQDEYAVIHFDDVGFLSKKVLGNILCVSFVLWFDRNFKIGYYHILLLKWLKKTAFSIVHVHTHFDFSGCGFFPLKLPIWWNHTKN